MNKKSLILSFTLFITLLILYLPNLVFSASIDHSTNMPPVRSQGSYQSCVGWATGYYYKTYQEKMEHGWDVSTANHQFSPSFVWNLSNDGTNSGMSTITGITNIINHGTPTYETMGNADYTTWPNQDQWQEAMWYRADSTEMIFHYFYGEPDIPNLKSHLDSGDIFVIVVPVYSDNLSATGGNDVHDYSTGSYRGTHALAVVGYDDNRSYTDQSGNPQTGAFKFVNSWGSGWSGDGYSWFSYNFVTNEAREAYTMVDKNNYQPLAWTNISISHPAKNQLNYGVGSGEYDEADWSKSFFYRQGAANADISATHDLTEAISYMPPNDTNSWFLNIRDNVNDGNSGTLDSFEIEYGSNTYSDTNLPIIIDQSSEYTIANIDTGGEGENNPPSQPDVDIMPASPKTTNDLTCQATNSIDPDGDDVIYQYSWYKNDILQPDLTENILSNSNTAKGDTWKCQVTPTDGKLNGGSGQTEKTIINSAPVLDEIGNKIVGEEEQLNFTISASDDDNSDVLTYSTSTLPDGASFNSEEREFSWQPANQQDGEYSITFTVDDGEETNDEAIIITVNNTVEDAPKNSTPVDEPTQGELTCRKADRILDYNDKIRPKGGGTISIYRSNKFGCGKYPILSPIVFNMRGYRWREIKEIKKDLFQDIPNRRILVHKNGSLIRATNSKIVWIIEKQYRHYIRTKKQLRRIRRKLPKSQRKIIDIKSKKLKRIRYGGETTLAEIIKIQYQIALY